MIGRFGITARSWARRGAAYLLLALLMAMAPFASAKPYDTQPGPMPEGDPTADDQPSPTPKKNSARFGGGTLTPDAAGPASPARPGRITWELYLKILSRLTLR
jgi:hypothetical protein